MKKRWYIPIAIAIVSITSCARHAVLGDSIDYAVTYLSCGIDNRIMPFKGKCGDCIINTNSGQISRAQIEYCSGGPLWSRPAIFEFQPKTPIDFWLLENTNSNDFAIACPGPLCGKNLQPEWAIETEKRACTGESEDCWNEEMDD